MVDKVRKARRRTPRARVPAGSRRTKEGGREVGGRVGKMPGQTSEHTRSRAWAEELNTSDAAVAARAKVSAALRGQIECVEELRIIWGGEGVYIGEP